ncbi:MAG TPA: GGDEF domain-containing protein [Longimicrobiales bacterium]|nr:GGDEF domain-containing protein [Longimicrobiales bacterium]
MTVQVEQFLRHGGVLLQLGGALLLAWLFLLLRPYVRRRRYFQVWGAAWAVLAIAIAAVVVRTIVLPGMLEGVPGTLRVWVVDYVYQVARLSFLALLVAGTMMYTRGSSITPFLPLAVGGAAAYSLLSLHFGGGVHGSAVWQAPVILLSAGWCGARLFLLPRSRRGVGARVAAVAFSAMALLAVTSFIGFGGYFGADGVTGLTGVLLRFNTYVDVLLHMVLGSGMVVMLMEDAKREVDDAHAELAVAHDELRRAALYDAVTGTLNRRAFAEGVGLDLARGQYGAVMMLDLDDLKSVNDGYGHSAGDALLRHLADAVRTSLRPSDRLYRWGGDEFLIVLPAADAAGAHSRLRGIMSSAASLQLGPGLHTVQLGVSMGAVDYAGGEDIAEAIERADALMYEDKARRQRVRRSGHPPA